MLRALGSLKPKPGKIDYRCSLTNPAVAHCQKTWEYVYRSVYKFKGSGALARIEAAEAFREAMPLLIGDKNIRDYIACVTFGMGSGILTEDTASRLLYAAQVAFKVGSRPFKRSKNAPSKAPNSNDSSDLTP